MWRYGAFVVVMVLGSSRSQAMRITRHAPEQCFGSAVVDVTLTAINELHCSTGCVRDDYCQGFCFVPADNLCLLTHRDKALTVDQMVDSPGATIFFIDLKEGFKRRGDKSYRFFEPIVTHYAARQACWNIGTNMILPKSAKEREYVRELAPGHVVWVLADDESQENTWSNTDTDEDLTYLPWSSGEPNGGVGEQCVIDALDRTKGWIDISCGRGYRYFCEEQLY